VSTENSPQNSTDYFGHGTTQESTNSRGGHIVSVALGALVLGASVVGTVLATRRPADRQAATALAAFMRHHHAMLTRDVVLAGGPVLDSWAYDLGLSPSEKIRLRRALEGSSEQGALVDALDGPIDEQRAQRFAAAFFRVAGRALGRARTEALVAQAGGRGRGA
jgi:hypothetical protein